MDPWSPSSHAGPDDWIYLQNGYRMHNGDKITFFKNLISEDIKNKILLKRYSKSHKTWDLNDDLDTFNRRVRTNMLFFITSFDLNLFTRTH